MGGMLAGTRVAMLGGDAREVILLEELLRQGAEVRVAGLGELPEQEGCACYDDPLDAVQGAGVIILPVPGIKAGGIIHAPRARQPLYFTRELAGAIPAGTPVLVGVARAYLKEMAAERGWQLVETAEMDEMAILNSIPTAEGAIMLAMQELPITLHGCEAFVLGLGRTGFTLARMLAGVGARVTVIDRGAADRARAYAEGWPAFTFTELAAIVVRADVIFNTVPAPVLTGELLARTRPDVLIIDLASDPGGTDFTAATALKRRAMLAPGLPGKVAPRTAGQILARIYPTLILNCLERL
ncbi:D-isomer specific 2-hydroxyacid dehydrogenase,NAD-binding [Moorella glycerini]|uniref:Dipicolinate synthase subunit A n=1 Tax=Neomoorella stamsii TaxID=1266720 RepID=A0A9X7J1T5_9FIRM|nr:MULTISPECIES: dipicolinate synthase subunit DpsA [Moorella]PRR71999.1 Dipicolinate synthase subunit A [Moorella stamsii]CEP66815.1 D-isomer specific 2-hydroxyacid dehydrogenase,NAD-binding [Moorella glycerini]